MGCDARLCGVCSAVSRCVVLGHDAFFSQCVAVYGCMCCLCRCLRKRPSEQQVPCPSLHTTACLLAPTTERARHRISFSAAVADGHGLVDRPPTPKSSTARSTDMVDQHAVRGSCSLLCLLRRPYLVPLSPSEPVRKVYLCNTTPHIHPPTHPPTHAHAHKDHATDFYAKPMLMPGRNEADNSLY